MLKYEIDGVEVTAVGLKDFSAQEAQNYVDYVLEHADLKAPLVEVKVKMCDDGKVDVSYLAKGEKFERIRRITGYCATRLYMKSMHAA